MFSGGERSGPPAGEEVLPELGISAHRPNELVSTGLEELRTGHRQSPVPRRGARH